MKRINYSLLGLTLLSMALLASCKKNNPSGGTPDGLGFRAMTEQNGGNGNNSKTHGVYDEDGGKVTVNWTAKDLIKVAVEDNIEPQYTFELTEGADNTSGDFYTGTPHPERSFFDESIHNYVAIYPATNRDGEANSITSANASTMVATFKLPDTQDYKANSFGEKAAPMIAHSENKTLQFKNIMGGICFYLKGDAIVTKIKLTTKAEEALWGTCTATLHGTGTEATITDEDISTSNSNVTAKKTVTLDCGSGVQLTPTASMFFILLPPGTLSSGFTLEVNGLDLAGGAERVLYKHDSRGEAKTIKRNSILKTSNSVYLKAGAIQAEFSVGAAHKVYFSKGNLQYNMTSREWSFLEPQYAIVESHKQDVGIDYSNQNIVTLFGWGTSGYNNTNDPNAICYNPYNTSIASLAPPLDASLNKFGYGPSTDMTDRNLVGTSANYDWGVYNSISNGGNIAGQWRTLTGAEWTYVLFTRNASTLNGTLNARYAKATVNGRTGVILFPDSYTHPSGVANPANINVPNVNSNTNNYTAANWTAMENAGCVFLPSNGWRGGEIVSNMDLDNTVTVGNYWSSTYQDNETSWGLTFNDDLNASNPAIFQVDGMRTRYNGFGVRLVHDIPYAP